MFFCVFLRFFQVHDTVCDDAIPVCVLRFFVFNFRYDTVHGVYGGDVSHDGEHLIVDGTKIKVRCCGVEAAPHFFFLFFFVLYICFFIEM